MKLRIVYEAWASIPYRVDEQKYDWDGQPCWSSVCWRGSEADARAAALAYIEGPKIIAELGE